MTFLARAPKSSWSVTMVLKSESELVDRLCMVVDRKDVLIQTDL